MAEDSLGTAVLELDVDSDKYTRGLKDAEGQADSFGKKSSSAMDDAGKRMDDAGTKAGGLSSKLGTVASVAGGFIVAQGITQMAGYLTDAAKAAAADEQATARLHQTLQNLGGSFDENLAKVNDAIASGEKLAFTDDEVRDSFQTLAVATGDTEEALDRQKIAMDLARGANIPLAAATKMVSKVNEESVDTFKRLGINIADGATEAEALAAVQAKFAGQSEAYASSTAGQFEVAQIKMAEAQETIGTALLPAMTALATVASVVLPVAFELLTTVIGGVVTAIEFVISHGQQLLPLFIGIGAGLMAVLIPALIAIIPILWAKAAAWTAVAIATIAANLPLILIVAAIALVVAGIVLLIQHWDTIVEKIPALGIAVDAVKAAFEAFVSWLTGTALPALQSFMDGAIAAFQGIVSFVEANWPILEAIITPVLDAIKLYVETTFDLIRIIIETAMGVLAGVMDVGMGVITGDWERAWDGIKQIGQAVWDGIVALVELGIETIKSVVSVGLGSIGLEWEQVWNTIKGVVEYVWDLMYTGISIEINAIMTVISTTLSTISTLWDGAMQKIYDVRDTFYAFRDGVIDAISGALSWVQSLIDKINSIPSPGDIVGGIGNAIGFATGTTDYPGGLGIVGERGPELVSLPRHTKIYPANESRSMMAKMRDRYGQRTDGATGGPQVSVNFLGPTRILASDMAEARKSATTFAWASMAAMRARGLS